MGCASLRTPMVRQVDVLVIGAGPGGYPAAIRAAQVQKRVRLVERDKLGGECLNYGCIPSKALIHTANLVHAIERAAERGVETGPVKVDMARLQQWKGAVVQRLSNGVGQLCKGNGVDVLAGHASFTGPDRATVRTPSGSEEIAFTDAIIATGGRPSDLPAFRFDGKRVLSTKEALELPRIPLNLAVIGGGISGLEIRTVYAKIGTRDVEPARLRGWRRRGASVPRAQGDEGRAHSRGGDRGPSRRTRLPRLAGGDLHGPGDRDGRPPGSGSGGPRSQGPDREGALRRDRTGAHDGGV